MKIIMFSILIGVSISLSAQKKLSFDLNASVLKSVGKEVSKTYHSNVNPLLSLNYLSRKRFKHLYFNLLGHITYSVSPKLGVGLQSGFYVHYLEKYFSNIERTTLSIPIMATFSYKLFDINDRPFGIEIATGRIFYKIDDKLFKIENGSLYNASAFYAISKKSSIKLGVEKQVDDVGFYFTADPPNDKDETYNYPQNRLSVILSYGLKL